MISLPIPCNDFNLNFASNNEQGPKLRLTGRQCDQRLSVGDQNFKTGRQ